MISLLKIQDAQAVTSIKCLKVWKDPLVFITSCLYLPIPKYESKVILKYVGSNTPPATTLLVRAWVQAPELMWRKARHGGTYLWFWYWRNKDRSLELAGQSVLPNWWALGYERPSLKKARLTMPKGTGHLTLAPSLHTHTHTHMNGKAFLQSRLLRVCCLTAIIYLSYELFKGF